MLKITTIKHYHDLYDFLSLVDVFEKVTNNSLRELWIMSNALFERTRLGCNA